LRADWNFLALARASKIEFDVSQRLAGTMMTFLSAEGVWHLEQDCLCAQKELQMGIIDESLGSGQRPKEYRIS
jgi:hypothetical protein